MKLLLYYDKFVIKVRVMFHYINYTLVSYILLMDESTWFSYLRSIILGAKHREKNKSYLSFTLPQQFLFIDLNNPLSYCGFLCNYFCATPNFQQLVHVFESNCGTLVSDRLQRFVSESSRNRFQGSGLPRHSVCDKLFTIL